MKKAEKAKTLLEFFRRSPLIGANLNLERDVDYGRDIDPPADPDEDEGSEDCNRE